MEDRPGDSNTPLHCHGTAKEQWAQAKEHHTCPKGAAHDVLRVKSLPFLLGDIDKKHQGASDKVTKEVCHHQAAGKQQEGSFGLDPNAAVGLDKDEKGEAVGQNANSHGDDRSGDRQLPLAAGTVAGSAL